MLSVSPWSRADHEKPRAAVGEQPNCALAAATRTANAASAPIGSAGALASAPAPAPLRTPGAFPPPRSTPGVFGPTRTRMADGFAAWMHEPVAAAVHTAGFATAGIVAVVIPAPADLAPVVPGTRAFAALVLDSIAPAGIVAAAAVGTADYRKRSHMIQAARWLVFLLGLGGVERMAAEDGRNDLSFHCPGADWDRRTQQAEQMLKANAAYLRTEPGFHRVGCQALVRFDLSALPEAHRFRLFRVQSHRQREFFLSPPCWGRPRDSIWMWVLLAHLCVRDTSNNRTVVSNVCKISNGFFRSDRI